jgi:hypothetical protein
MKVTTRKKYQVLSPDGFTIDGQVRYYTSRKKAIEAIENWKKRFEMQGYYSSNKCGRIHLDKLQEHCTIKEL